MAESESTGEQNVRTCICIRILCRDYAIPYIMVLVFLTMAVLIAIVFHGRKRSSEDKPVHGISEYRVLNTYGTEQNENHYDTTETHKYTYLASVVSVKPDLFLCSCVIIKTQYAVTSANCYTNTCNNSMLRTGSKLWDSGGRTYPIDKFTTYENFSDRTFTGNIALIKTSRPIILSNNVSLCKIWRGNVFDASGMMVGWRKFDIQKPGSTSLTEQKINIWNSSSCENYLKTVDESTFCASLKCDECNLDIVGPLVIHNQVAGIWSMGLSCSASPSIFTKISYYSKWILRNIKSK